MKTTNKFAILTLAALLGLASCKKDDDYTAPVSEIEVVKSNFTYEYTAGTGRVELSHEDFSVETDAEWLHATKEGKAVILTLDKNEGAEARVGNVIVKKGQTVQRIPITQMGVVNVMSLNDLEFTRRGGEASFSIERMDSQPTFVSSADWLRAEVVDGKLVVRAAAFPAGHTADRSATLRVRAGLFDRTITVTQKYGVPEYADLLGTYTLEFNQWAGSAKTTMNLELVANEENKNFILRGLAADIVLTFNPATAGLSILPQEVAGGVARVYFWTADGNGWFDANHSLTAAWDQNRTTPGFAFSSTGKINGEFNGTTKDWPIRGIIFWGQSEYFGPSGNGVSRVVDFKLTKQ